MPEFILRVGTPEGDVIERPVVAASLRAAQEEARRQGLHVFGSRRGSFRVRDFLPRFGRAVSTEHFLLFNQELLALVRAGLPIVQSFDILLDRQKNPRFREILTEIRQKLTSGVALSDAFAAYGDLFPPIYSTSLRAGERSGDLEGVIKRFLRYQKLIVTLRKRVVGAMVYPAILVLLSTGMVFVMMTFVIPKFAEFFEGFGQELPWFTQVMITVATFMRQNVLLMIIGIALAAFLVNRWVKTGGRLVWDRLKLRIPLVGGVLHRFAIMQFTQSLGTLLAGGTPMVPAIEIASQSVTNAHVSTKISGIVQNVR
ncbi:MAG: type II secretion system F family protein, partial [Thermoanaerobaculia bacterium]